MRRRYDAKSVPFRREFEREVILAVGALACFTGALLVIAIVVTA